MSLSVQPTFLASVVRLVALFPALDSVIKLSIIFNLTLTTSTGGFKDFVYLVSDLLATKLAYV